MSVLRVRPAAVSSVAAVAAAAWLALIVWGRTPYARFLDHGRLEDVEALPVAVAGWVVMIVAMMLPTSLPLVDLFRRMIARREDRRRLQALLLGGYLGVWTAFGVLVHAGDLSLHALAAGAGWVSERPSIIAAAVLGVAGLYQFSSLKYRCLAKCRSPRMFVAGHWRGRNAAREALALGAHHGLYCLGCCWTLMLVMFAVGVGNLAWMLALGAAMALEKNAPWGRRLSRPLGLSLIALSLVTLIGGPIVA